MSSLAEYATRYKSARMERRNGVLQVTLHTEGQSLRWGFLPHGELPEAFHDIGVLRVNVVLFAGVRLEIKEGGADLQVWELARLAVFAEWFGMGVRMGEVQFPFA